jgi:hypothetical protein
MIDGKLAIPIDKKSRPMRLLLSFNFSQSAQFLSNEFAANTRLPSHGRMSVFISEDIDKCQPKDKSCFKIIWQPDATEAPDTTPSAHSHLIVKTNHARLLEAKAICAFSANGISYNQARARDDCYSHLIEQVPNWHLVTSVSDGHSDYLLLIHANDMEAGLFEKGWLVRFKGNS